MQLQLEQHCLVCKQSSPQLICQHCKSDLPMFELGAYHYNLMLMPKVQSGLTKVDFPRALAVSRYQWPLSRLLTGLKFSAFMPNAKALANLFVEHCIQPLPEQPQLIIPIPLHKNRYLSRKFNQSIELTKQIEKLTNIPINTSILQRNKATQAQTKLSAAKRRQNLKNAFLVAPSAIQILKRYQHIALFDDVITTGATMNCAYNSLRELIPSLRIDIWSICITLERR